MAESFFSLSPEDKKKLQEYKNRETVFDPGKIISKAAAGLGEAALDLTELNIDLLTAGKGGKKFRNAISEATKYVDNKLQETSAGRAISEAAKETVSPSKLSTAEDVAADILEFGIATRGIGAATKGIAQPTTKLGKFGKLATDGVLADVLVRDRDEQITNDFIQLVPESEEYIGALAIDPDDELAEKKLKQLIESAIAGGIITAAAAPAILALKFGGRKLFSKVKALKKDKVDTPIENTSKVEAKKTKIIPTPSGGYVQRTGLIEKMGKVNTKLGRLFTSKAGLPDELFNSYLRKQRFAEGADIEVQKYVRELKEVIEKNKDKLSPEDFNNLTEMSVRQIQQAVRSGTVPKEVADKFLQLRKSVDANETKLLDLLDIDKDSALGIKMDKDYVPYITRSYETFTNPKWSTEIKKALKDELDPDLSDHNAEIVKIVDNAKRYIRKNNKGLNDEEVNAVITNIVEQGKKGGQLKAFIDMMNGTVAGQKIKVLKTRKDLDKPILDLLGEVKDPTRKFETTLRNQNKLIAEAEYLKDVKKYAEQNLGKEVTIKGLFPFLPQEKTTFLKKGVYSANRDIRKSMADLGSDVQSFGGQTGKIGLNNYVTTESMHEIFKNGIDLFDNPYGNSWLGKVTQKTLGTAQAMETVFDHTAHALNVYGAIQQLMMNGHAFDRQILKSAQKNVATVIRRAKKNNDPAAIEFLRKAKNRGVIDSNLVSETVLKNVDRYGDKLKADSKFATPFQFVEETFDKGVKGASAVYGGADDVSKLMALDAEIKQLTKVFPNKTKDEIFDIAAERVRNTMLSYSTAIPLVRIIGKMPLGTYATFPAEILRSNYHIIRYGIKDIMEGQATGNTAQTLMGLKRLSAAAGTAAGLETIINTNNEKQGVSAVEERGVNLMSPDYAKNSKKVFTKGFEYDPQTGHIMTRYVDSGFIDSAQSLKGPLRAITGKLLAGGEVTQRELDDVMLDIAKESLSPYISEKFLTAAILNASRGVDAEGRTIEGDSFAERLPTEIGKVFIPGGAKNIKRYLDARASENFLEEQLGTEKAIGRTKTGFPVSKNEQLGFNLTGVRNNTVDITKAVGYSMYEDSKKVNETQAKFKKYLNEIPVEQMTESDVQDLYNEYRKLQDEKYEAMARLTDKAMVFMEMQYQVRNPKDGTVTIKKFGIDGLHDAVTSDKMYKPAQNYINALTSNSRKGTVGYFTPDRINDKQLIKLLRDKRIPDNVIYGLEQIARQYEGLPLRKIRNVREEDN